MSFPETYHRVLVPLDGSPLAEAVLPFVSRLARPLGLEIALLRVVPMVTPKIVQGGTGPIILDQGERLREEAEAYLRGVAAGLVADGFPVTTTVRTGEAAPEIVAGARECQADLIGMMTHGRAGTPVLRLRGRGGLAARGCSGVRRPRDRGSTGEERRLGGNRAPLSQRLLRTIHFQTIAAVSELGTVALVSGAAVMMVTAPAAFSVLRRVS